MNMVDKKDSDQSRSFMLSVAEIAQLSHAFQKGLFKFSKDVLSH